MSAPLEPGRAIGFVGLGNMGLPMASRLVAAGYIVTGYDVSADACAALGSVPGARAADAASAVADGAAAVILMLPTSEIVDRVLTDGGLLTALAAGATLIDMSSSEPLRTRANAAAAQDSGKHYVDAPVSGGVRGATAGTLTIMAGGDAAIVASCQPLLAQMGKSVVHVGPVGAGHAVKALNNLLSATHLLASCEALRIAERFGVEPEALLGAINGSSGRSASTEFKLPEYVLPRNYTSGFPAGLMTKDVGIAVALGDELDLPPALGHRVLELWQLALQDLPAGADHTEIGRWEERSS